MYLYFAKGILNTWWGNKSKEVLKYIFLPNEVLGGCIELSVLGDFGVL